MSFYYKPYVPVAKRREKALKKMAKLKKKGVDVQPVEIQGRKISKTFCHKISFVQLQNSVRRSFRKRCRI